MHFCFLPCVPDALPIWSLMITQILFRKEYKPWSSSLCSSSLYSPVTKLLLANSMQQFFWSAHSSPSSQEVTHITTSLLGSHFFSILFLNTLNLYIQYYACSMHSSFTIYTLRFFCFSLKC
jgi:hypothetical protein